MREAWASKVWTGSDPKLKAKGNYEMAGQLPQQFSSVSSPEIERLRSFISPRRNSKLEEVLVYGDGKLWFLNTVGNTDQLRTPRSYLGYLLAKPFANVAEIQALTEEAAQALRNIGLRAASSNCFIVREASSYNVEELPCKELDQAVAAEFVVSLWIRRRDLHNENHSYTCDGLPVFFDFDVAFVAEGTGEGLNEFFSRADKGYAGSWRVFEVPLTDLPVTTTYSRRLGCQSSLIPVISIRAFSDHCYRVAQAIQTDNRNIAELANKAKMGHAERDKIVRLLERNKHAITTEVETMLKMVT